MGTPRLVFDAKPPSKAEAEFRRALADAPYYADAFYNFGILLLHQGRSEEAVEQCGSRSCGLPR